MKSPFLRENVWYRKKMIMEQLAKYPHLNILEIGCGLFPLFMDIDNFNSYTIIEPSEEFCKNAKCIADRQGKEIRIIHEKCENVTEGMGEYDFIICSSLLHEVKNPEVILQCIMDIANKDTVIHINVPNANSMHRLLAKEGGLIKDTHSLSDTNIRLQQYRVFDLDTLEKFVVNFGFQVIETGGRFIKPFTHAQMQQLIELGIINNEVLQGLYGLAHYMEEFSSEIFVNLRIK